MTLLRTISQNHLFLTCMTCHHKGMVAVADLIDSVGAMTTVHQVVAKARCSKCGSKNIGDLRILYVGNSSDALEGARATKGATESD